MAGDVGYREITPAIPIYSSVGGFENSWVK